MEEEGSCFVILEGRRFEGWFALSFIERIGKDAEIGA